MARGAAAAAVVALFALLSLVVAGVLLPAAVQAAAEVQPAPSAAGAGAAAIWDHLQERCIQHPQAGSLPAFPRPARQAGLRGRIVAVLHFDAADRPPSVELVHRPTAYILRQAVEEWAAGLRRPCHAGDRVSVHLTFDYQFTGENAGFARFAPSDLLALARDRRQRQPFDTSGMRCPLVVQWQYLQPYRANRVSVQGPPDPAHGPIIQRLQALELALTRPAADVAWGDTARFEIPCPPGPAHPATE